MMQNARLQSRPAEHRTPKDHRWTRRAIFVCADGDGRLTGGDAVEFFKRSGLPRDQLAKVWAMADSSRRGFLDQHSFSLVRTHSTLEMHASNERMLNPRTAASADDLCKCFSTCLYIQHLAATGGLFVRQAMEYISVSQQVGDVSQQLYDREKAAGHVAAPMMGGLHDLLQVTAAAQSRPACLKPLHSLCYFVLCSPLHPCWWPGGGHDS